MDVTCSASSGLRSIFDSVRFNTEHLTENYPRATAKVGSPPKRLKIGDVNRDVELEALSLILKLWLRRIHLTEEEGRRTLRNFEAEINLTQKNVIEPDCFRVNITNQKNY